MSKPIKELIEEAQELGVNIHDHVAQELWGTVNMITRHSAKQYTFCHLYGGTAGNHKQIEGRAHPANRGGPWKMTEEQIKAQCQVPKDFKQTWMGEPHEDRPVMEMHSVPYLRSMTERETQQSEDRMHRVGVVPFEVKVSDGFGFHVIYTIHATTALDARCMAFVLDYGHKTKHWDDGHIERALACTEIIE
jgi:hypothetical protein